MLSLSKHVAVDFVMRAGSVSQYAALPFDGLKANGSFSEIVNPIRQVH